MGSWWAKPGGYLTQFDKKFISLSRGYGGWLNYHAHPNRASISEYFTDAHGSASKFSMKQKQNLIAAIHQNKNYKKTLEQRMGRLLSVMHKLGTRRLYGFVDVAPSCGLDAIRAALEVKKKYRGKVDFQIGAYPVLGLGSLKDERWKLLAQSAAMSDFIGGLPEKDDKPGAMGSFQSMKAMLRLAVKLGKEAHFHVDQKNHPDERMTEMLVEAVKEVGSPKVKGQRGPTVWAVHSISPSCYPKKRLQKLISSLKRLNIGVVCCPNTISMMQLENSSAPIHNCVAPLLRLLDGGVEVRIGSDNIEDHYMPNGTPDLCRDVYLLSNAVRYYDADLYARLCCGKQPTNQQRKEMRAYLKKAEKAMAKAVADIKYQNKLNKA